MMALLADQDKINAMLNEFADDGLLEPMVEPVDDPNFEIDFWDWADIVGVVDDIVPDYAN